MLGACNSPALAPLNRPDPNVPEWAFKQCGVSPKMCVRTSSCCMGIEQCGGDPGVVGCPNGYCCDVDDDQGPEVGASRNGEPAEKPMRVVGLQRHAPQ